MLARSDAYSPKYLSAIWMPSSYITISVSIFSGAKRRHKMMVRSTARLAQGASVQAAADHGARRRATSAGAQAVVTVEEMHRELSRETRVKSLFAAMVDVPRVQRSTRRRLNAIELRALIAK
jgi:hypothetical protein